MTVIALIVGVIIGCIGDRKMLGSWWLYITMISVGIICTINFIWEQLLSRAEHPDISNVDELYSPLWRSSSSDSAAATATDAAPAATDADSATSAASADSNNCTATSDATSSDADSATSAASADSNNCTDTSDATSSDADSATSAASADSNNCTDTSDATYNASATDSE